MKYGQELLVAQQVTKAAGELIRRQVGKQEYQKNGKEFKAAIDIAADNIGVNVINQAFPDDVVLTEERGIEEAKNKNRIWYCDLLDGTTNFLNGNPMYTVLCGFEEDGIMRVGASFEPACNRIMLATEGQGVTCNGKQVLPKDRLLEESIILLDSGYDPDGISWIGRNYDKIRNKCGNIGIYNANGYSLCALARGEVGAMIHLSSKIWEVAAIFIAEQSGAIFSDFNGNSLRPEHLSLSPFSFLASKGIDHKELVELVQSLNK